MAKQQIFTVLSSIEFSNCSFKNCISSKRKEIGTVSIDVTNCFCSFTLRLIWEQGILIIISPWIELVRWKIQMMKMPLS